MASKLEAHAAFIRRQLRRQASIRAIVEGLAHRGTKAGRNAVHHFVTTRFGDHATRTLLAGDLAATKRLTRTRTAAAVAAGKLTGRAADHHHSAWRGTNVVSFEFAGKQVPVAHGAR